MVAVQYQLSEKYQLYDGYEYEYEYEWKTWLSASMSLNMMYCYALN